MFFDYCSLTSKNWPDELHCTIFQFLPKKIHKSVDKITSENFKCLFFALAMICLTLFDWVLVNERMIFHESSVVLRMNVRYLIDLLNFVVFVEAFYGQLHEEDGMKISGSNFRCICVIFDIFGRWLNDGNKSLLQLNYAIHLYHKR